MSILLTRPECDSRRIAELLDLPDENVLIWPLAIVESSDEGISIDPDVRALLFTSANGVAAFAASCPHRHFPAFCVGSRTADVAHKLGFSEIRNADGTASDLAALALASGYSHFLYPRGLDVSFDLASQLSKSGVRVDEMIVYAVRDGGVPPGNVDIALRNGSIRLVTVWSAANAIRLADWIDRNPDWKLERCDLLAISPKAVGPLSEAGFCRIIVAQRPDGDAMLEGISAALRQNDG